MMKRFAIILLAIAALVGVGIASAAQTRSVGGGQSGGSWHSGGNWSGNGNWSGGGNWSGRGNWSGSHWNGGNWRGHSSRVFIGVGFGAPWWGWGWPGYWPAYYPAYYPYYSGYYYPYYTDYYPYGYDSAPRYIQKDGDQGGQSDYSYYCPDPAGYYPQITTCAKGWLRVAPSGAPGPATPPQR